MATQRAVLRFEAESPKSAEELQKRQDVWSPQPGKGFGALTAFVQIVFLAAFQNCKVEEDTLASSDRASSTGVALMVFVGFGYLKTFLKAYGLSAVGFSLLISCVGIQWALILDSFMRQEQLTIGLSALIRANVAVVAVLVSFGAMIGRISPLQIVMLVMMELPCFMLHEALVLRRYDAQPLVQDDGRSLLHVFGAYFGLAAACVLGPSAKDKLRTSSYQSDVLALLGTVLLWVCWPSFVAAGQATAAAQLKAVLNTVLALLTSTVMTFGLSQILQDGRLDPHAVQNATLAGGVAIGATANVVGPFGAALLGAVAGTLATSAFLLSPAFRDVDTCGIHNLHGLPGVLGGMCSAMMPWFYPNCGFVSSHQWAGLVATMVLAFTSGALSGTILKVADSCESDAAIQRAAQELELPPEELVMEQFSDDLYWTCAEDVPRSLPLIQL